MSWANEENGNNISNSINDDSDLNTRLLAASDRAISTDRSSLRKERMKSIEFEESPRKLSVYIDLKEAQNYLNPYHLTNIGIFASYLAVGFNMYFIQTPLNYYMVYVLNATAAQQTVVTGLLSLPWSLKIACGFLSDTLPIFGYRRKSYFILGWTTCIVCNVLLAVLVEPTLAETAALVFFETMGMVLADVCTDACIVERSKAYEHIDNRGTLQATGYIIRFFGAIVGSILGAILYNKNDSADSWSWGLPIWGIFLLNAIIPLTIITPFFYSLLEIQSEVPPSIKNQVTEIWNLVQRKAAWKPCCFIYIYNLLFLSNPAWNSFLVYGLGFTNFYLGLLTIVGSVISYFALVFYRYFLFDTPWRKIYLFTGFIGFVFSCLQLILVFQINEKIGLGGLAGSLFFALGAYGVIQFVAAIQFLPSVKMFLGLCPDGAEGASYAMLTTISNLAGTASYSIAGVCANLWDVSNNTLAEHNYSGMWRLTLFCGCIQLMGLFFLPLLPNGIAEQVEMQANDSNSKTAGIIFLSVIGISLTFVISFTIYTIING